MPNVNPTADQLANRLSPTATNITIPTSGLFKAAGDNGDAVYSFDSNGVPTAYNLLQQGKAANDYGANLAALSSYGVDWNSLPTFNRADIDQQLLAKGMVTSGGTAKYNQGGGLSDLAKLSGVAATSTNQTVNNTPNTAASPATISSQLASGPQAVALPNNGGAPPQTATVTPVTPGNNAASGSLAAPQYQLQPGETVAQYNARIAASNPNLPAPGTTSSTGVTNSAPITSTSLTPPSSLNFQTPIVSPAGNAAATAASTVTAEQNAAAYALTAQQQKQSDLSTKIAGENTQEAGKPAAQIAADKAAGVDVAQQAVNDLNTKMTQLSKEAAAIPQQIELDSTGRGISAGGIKPLQTAALRNNSIQVLTTSALLDAAKNNLVSAQAKSNKAVALIFEPLEAQIAADTANLKLIQNDPNTTVQEQKQAQAQLDIKNQQAQAIADQKTNLADIFTVATNAAAQIANFTPNAQYQSASQALTAIQQAHTKGDALSIAVATGLTGPKAGSWSDPYMLGGSYVQKNTATGEVRQAVNPPNTSAIPPEDKAIAAFQSDAADFITKLGANTVSWGTAWNSLHAKYPQASNELIDQTLNKDKYYTVNP